MTISENLKDSEKQSNFSKLKTFAKTFHCHVTLKVIHENQIKGFLILQGMKVCSLLWFVIKVNLYFSGDLRLSHERGKDLIENLYLAFRRVKIASFWFMILKIYNFTYMGLTRVTHLLTFVVIEI